jgi:hypothetical protein
MGNDPKKPSQRQDLKRWDDEGGAPRSGHHFDEPQLPSAPETESALYYFNIRTESGVIEDPEGNVHTDLQAARKEALASARDLIAEGDRVGEDRRSWRFEIMNRANQHVLTVMFSEALASGDHG